MPDVLVKGGDYTIEEIAGAKEVIENGGKVVINPIKKGFSTTSIIEKISGVPRPFGGRGEWGTHGAFWRLFFQFSFLQIAILNVLNKKASLKMNFSNYNI